MAMSPQRISTAKGEGSIGGITSSNPALETVSGEATFKKRKRLRSIRDRNALRQFSRHPVGLDSQDSSASDDFNVHSGQGPPGQHFGNGSARVLQVNLLGSEDVCENKILKSSHRQRKNQKEKHSLERVKNLAQGQGARLDLESGSSRTSGHEETSCLIPNQSRRDEQIECPLCLRRRFREIQALMHHLLHGHSLDLSEEHIKRLKHLLLFKRNEVSPALNSSPKYSKPYDASKRVAKRYPNSTIPLTSVDLEIRPLALPATTSKARLVDGSFTCLKCSRTFDSEIKFLLHAKLSHVWNAEEISRLIENGAELEPSEFWCPECGTTFVTKSALMMHLKGSHEFVNDVHGYLEQVGYEGDVPAVENQCSVCFRILNNSWEFEKHVRNHGLAFLRRQQLLTKLRTG